MFVVQAFDSNERWYDGSHVFNTIYKSVESAKAAIIEEASYMLLEDMEPDLEWEDDKTAWAFGGDMLYKILEMTMEN